MNHPDASRVARQHMRTKTAGEVRFIKDRGGDKNEWGWGSPGPSEREIDKDFVFKPGQLKPLAQTLRSSLMALGHATSAYNAFVKIKSRNISPDGSLGGKGYIQKITDLRRQYMNVIEALSAATDTIYDELQAPHWDPAEDTMDSRDRDEVREIVEDAEEIKADPEGWAEEEEAEMDDESETGEEDGVPRGKTASTKTASPEAVAFWDDMVSLDPPLMREADRADRAGGSGGIAAMWKLGEFMVRLGILESGNAILTLWSRGRRVGRPHPASTPKDAVKTVDGLMDQARSKTAGNYGTMKNADEIPHGARAAHNKGAKAPASRVTDRYLSRRNP